MFLYIFKIIIKLIMTSSRFDPGSTSIRPQKPWISPFYGSMNGSGLKTLIVVTPDLTSEVLHVPRVAHPDYLGCECLWTVSRDNLLSHFCRTPSIWGGKLNTPCLGFAKGSRFLKMVMTFTLTPLSHYNSITEPRAHFLLSLMEDLVGKIHVCITYKTYATVN